VGVWVGPDGESVLAGLNPGSYSAGIESDLSKPLPPLAHDPAFKEIESKLEAMREKVGEEERHHKLDLNAVREYETLSKKRNKLREAQQRSALENYQDDWATRVQHNGEVTGVFTDYHYYGTGDIGGAPDEDSVRRLEAMVTKSSVRLPPMPLSEEASTSAEAHHEWPSVKVGDGPVNVVPATGAVAMTQPSPAVSAPTDVG